MAKGDHIIVPLCELATGHGIGIGDGTVVHWSSGTPGEKGPQNMSAWKPAPRIRRTPIQKFGDQTQIKVREYESCFDPDTAVRRALSRVGEGGYHVALNNCEQFATWCKTGGHCSEQVKDAFATVLRIGGVRLVATLWDEWLDLSWRSELPFSSLLALAFSRLERLALSSRLELPLSSRSELLALSVRLRAAVA